MSNYWTSRLSFRKIVITLYFIGCLIFFAFFYQYHLYYLEQMQFFRLNWNYIVGYFYKPASLSCLIGDFLTQFYYLRAGGAVIITGCLLLLWYLIYWITSHIFSWKYSYPFSLLATALVTGYHFTIVYPLAATVSLIIALAVFRLYTLLSNSSIRIIAGIILVPLLYIAVGLGVYLFVLVVVLYELKIKQIKSWLKWVYGFILISIVAISPVSMRAHYYLPAGQAYIYPVTELEKPTPDFTFESLLSIDCEWYFNHPEEVLELANKTPVKTRYVIYYYNLASAALNQLPENFLSFDQIGLGGIFIPFKDNEQTNYLSILIGNEVYYFIGDINTSEHYALMANTYSPKCICSRAIRRLAETNIINGEYAAAEKYLKILDQTIFYRQWAHEMEQYLYNDSLCNNTPWIANKRAQMPVKDHIAANPNYFINTLDYLLEDHPDNQAALDYLLCTCLLYKDIESFYKALTNYKHNCRGIYLPKLYQEALIVYFGTHKDVENFKSFKFTNETMRQSTMFQERYSQSQGNGSALYQDFGNTYLFYYSFANVPNQN